MRAIDEEYLTVSEAAALLRVAPSTIRRWIREGELPAYRLGRRRVGLKRDELSRLVKPMGSQEALGHDTAADADLEHITRRKLTPEEVASEAWRPWTVPSGTRMSCKTPAAGNCSPIHRKSFTGCGRNELVS